MKGTSYFLLATSYATAAAALTTRRQLPSSHSPLSIKKVAPVIDTTGASIREIALFGPFKLKASTDNHTLANPGAFKLDANSDLLTGILAGLCANCMVLEAKSDLARQDGGKADIGDGVYSHHIIISDVGRKTVVPAVKAVCAGGKTGGFNFQLAGMMGKGPAKGGMAGMSHGSAAAGGGHARRQGITGGGSVFVGQGDEGSAMTFQMPKGKLKSGFYISRGEAMMLMAEVINYEKSARDVYVTLEYEYIPNLSPRPKEYYDVGMGAINVSPCPGESMNLIPPKDKAVKYASPPWDVTADGYLINVKPHLHDGGVNMTFFVNGKEACSSSAVYGGTDGGLAVSGQKWETITAYTPCHEEISIKKGDKLTMEAWYDLTQHRLRPQADDHSEEAEGMALATFLYARPPTS